MTHTGHGYEEARKLNGETRTRALRELLTEALPDWQRQARAWRARGALAFATDLERLVAVAARVLDGL
ncbi:MAG TPA: hypothetical protein VLV16_05535 [Gemmatimonadales bacterium]|nr:hypothetical protein [Gemmatimonadales bacterium]